MAEQLNKTIAEMEYDELIYDNSHEIDAKNVSVQVTGSGTLKRGQLLDIKDGERERHVKDGEADAIVARDVAYTEDGSVIASVYISGTFRTNRLVTDETLTDADVETLRGKGIYLK
jgi:hypothetical protein